MNTLVAGQETALLLLPRDVDCNPGATNHEHALEIRKIAAHINIMKNENKTKSESLISFHAKLHAIELIKNILTDVEGRIGGIELALFHFSLQIDDLQSRSRCSNLIICAVDEKGSETPKSLDEEVAEKVIHDKIEVSIAGIERMRRLGIEKEG